MALNRPLFGLPTTSNLLNMIYIFIIIIEIRLSRVVNILT